MITRRYNFTLVKFHTFHEILKMANEKSRQHWLMKELPKVEGDKFPNEGDTFNCKCGLLMEFVEVGGDDGSGFTCASCDEQLWCIIDETKMTDKYDKEYYIWERT